MSGKSSPDVRAGMEWGFNVHYLEEYRYDSRQGIANLGIAPTIREDNKPVLEVHLFDAHQEWLNHDLEIVFKHFIRPEQKFHSIEELRQQIHRDIELVKGSSL